MTLKKSCKFCDGEGTVWFGANGWDFEYPCPECDGEPQEKVYDGRL